MEALLRRQNVPLRHATTTNANEAAQLYAQHALVLNIPLNQDLNHRLFEVMAAGVPQVIFGDRSLLGDNSPLANRPDLFWANSIGELEAVVEELFADPTRLRAIPIDKTALLGPQSTIERGPSSLIYVLDATGEQDEDMWLPDP